MDAAEWNATYPIGTKVVLRLANGKRHVTRTTSEAEHIGQHDFIRVAHIPVGLVLLTWVRPFHPGDEGPGGSAQSPPDTAA